MFGKALPRANLYLLRSFTFPRILALTLMVGTTQTGCDRSSPPIAQPQPADTIYTNARVWTVNPDQEWAEAFAIQDGRFVSVGSADEVAALAAEGTKTIDLEGAMVLPGLYDIHVHLRGWYAAAALADELVLLPGDAGPDAAAEIIRDFVAARPDLEYLFGFGLANELFDGEPTSAWLDSAVSDIPAYIITATGHEAVLNSPAMALSGVDADTPDPRNGIITRDPETGEATGYMKESAMGVYAMPFLKDLDIEIHVAGARDVLHLLASTGVTSARNMHGELIEVQALNRLATTEGLPIRVSVAWTYDAPTRAFQSVEEQRQAIEMFEELTAPRLNPNFVKVNIDGIPTETAAMLEPFVTPSSEAELFEPDTAAIYEPLATDDGDRGLIFFTEDELAGDIVRFEKLGLSGMVFHTVGDRGARLVLDAMEIAQERLGGLNGRYQLAHAFFIAEDDLPRLAEVDLTPEFSPILWFSNPLNDVVEGMVGDERAARIFPMRSAADAGARVVLASDGPLFMQSPLGSIEAAVTRFNPVNNGGRPDPAAAEAITLEEAIAARTINSAYLDFAEDELGSIEVGKLADFVVLDRDLFAIPIDEVSEAQVLKTVVEGAVVFEATAEP